MNILNIEDLNYHSAPDPATSGHNFIVTFFICAFHQINFSLVEKNIFLVINFIFEIQRT